MGIFCVFVLSGAIFIDDAFIVKKVRKFEVKPYKYGLFISEPESEVFYNFSPYADYFLDQDKKIRLVAWDQGFLAKEYSYKYNKLVPQLLTIATYFNLITPTATFDSSFGPIKYSARSINNLITVEISRKLSGNPARKIFTEILLHENDYVFDEDLVLYSTQNSEELDKFKNFHQLELKHTLLEVAASEINSKYLYVINPSNSGVIRFRLMNQTVRYDNEDLALIFDSQTPAQSAIEVEVFDSLVGARETL